MHDEMSPTRKDRTVVRDNSHSDPGIGDIFPPWKEYGDRFTRFFSYLRTRRAIRTGTALWDWSKADLQANRLLEPWAFNLYQSTLSAAPGIVAVAVLSFLAIDVPEKLTFQTEFDEQVFRYFEKVYSYLSPLIIPISLGVACFGTARGSLDPSDRSRDRLVRARRAYLYFDGAYGLWAQALISLGLTFMFTLSREILISSWVSLIAFALLLIPAIKWQQTISMWKIPKALSVVNGYYRKYPKAWFLFRRDQNSASWRRFVVWGIVFVAAVVNLIGQLFLLIAQFIAYGLMYMQLFVRSLLA